MKGVGAVLSVALLASPAGAGEKLEKLEGYAEWRRGPALVVDGQRVRAGAAVKFKGKGEARDFDSIPLGYEVKVKGLRATDGTFLAREVEAKPNGEALFEGDLRRAFDETEARFLDQGRVFEQRGDGQEEVIGEIIAEGPLVDRARAIAEDVCPPYLDPGDFRVYVVDNDEWNAMAAPNRSLYVYRGLLEDFDDDEVAIVIGHELVHSTHEHGRKGFKRQLAIMIPAALLGVATESIDNDTRRVLTQVGLFVMANALTSGYGRDQEDQADRAGLRYAYEGGYDVSKGPGLWLRFAARYGQGHRFVNAIFGDHSLARARAANLRREIELNYSDR